MILVTGATGFLGAYFLYFLSEKKKNIRVLKRQSSNFEQIEIAFDILNPEKQLWNSFDDYIKSIEFVNADILDVNEIEDSLKNVDEVFHLAAVVSFSKKNNELINDVNIRGTSILVNQCIKNNISKFHFASSIASLNRNNENIITESNDVNNKKFSTIYSKSKYLAELEVWRGYAEGLTGVIINPGVILGPAVENHESMKVFKTIKNGFSFYPKGKNGYVDVRDTAELFLLLSEKSELYNERYLLVSDNHHYIEIFNWMAKYFNVKAPSKLANINLSYMLSYIESIRIFFTRTEAIITKDLVKLVNSIYIYNNSKLKSAINYNFRSVEETIKDTCNFVVAKKYF